jgi:signal transduction histidine kinase
MRRDGLDEAVMTRAIDVIERAATLQAKLIDDMLDVSRIVAGTLRLDLQPVELIPIIDAAIDTMRPIAEAKGIEIESNLDPLSGTTAGDASRLQQILGNLLSNAIKFTPTGGRVYVQLTRVNDNLEIIVKDTGEGIDPQFLPHVLEPFRQADNSEQRRHGGLGLGLAIVRQLVELHGGVVHVASEGRGCGATLTVKLPVLQAD